MNFWLNWNGKEVIPVGFLTIYVASIIIIGAIVVAINIRLIRREKNDSADTVAKTSSAEGQRDETISKPRQKTVTESSRPFGVTKADPTQKVVSSVHDEALSSATSTAPGSTPIFQQRSPQTPRKQVESVAKRPFKAVEEAIQEKRDSFKMSDDDYRTALRQLSGLATPDKKSELDKDPILTSDDAYREALRSMINKKQDSC